jgi:hypothetical protein
MSAMLDVGRAGACPARRAAHIWRGFARARGIFLRESLSKVAAAAARLDTKWPISVMLSMPWTLGQYLIQISKDTVYSLIELTLHVLRS